MPIPGNHQDSRLLQMLQFLTEWVDAAAAVPSLYTPFYESSVIFVTPTGSDVTGQKNRPDLPFATIGRAMSLAASGETIIIGPGTYAENVVIPATLSSLNIIGFGIYGTVIQPLAGIALSYAATSTGTVMTRLRIENMSLVGVTDGLSVTSALAPSGFQDGVYLDHVFASSSGGVTALRFAVCNNVSMVDCVTPAADDVRITTVSSATIRNCETGQLRFSYLPADAVKPSLGVRRKYVYDSHFNGADVTSIDDVVFDFGCVSDAAVTATVVDDALGSGRFEFHGLARLTMTLAHTLTANRTAFICDRCKVVGNLIVASVGAAAGFIATANFRGAVLSTAATPGITTGNNTALDLLEAAFNHGAGVLVSAGAGTPGVANRSVHRQAVNIAGGGPQTVTFDPDFMDANYSVSVETWAANTDALVTAKTAAQFVLTAVGADAGANIVVLHQ